ncbi:outer membrane beta-barrel protein [Cellulophaga sp. F20128]|uniref:outer membrane beta-barrel protein n=1 Tax=Cellulophaga sp. F20128 TaxID=2926413 RepID=UPI001FF60818|nr:outer membrane beta-barrel protein [Cellulophaga sp. F20128]MCK0155919.1 outer membrane beta-barrel protein [Cellulophaga sp. F20128]
MLKKSIFVLFLVASTTLFSQKFSLDGVVKDEDANTLEGATVFVLNIQDSIAIAYAITNKNGLFSLKVNAEDQPKVIFKIAYLGYKTYSQDLNVPKANELNMGTVTLSEQSEELEEIALVGKAPPILIKKDTIEYNADSFKTLPNAKVEDLLKKLPGIEIDDDGVITSNGVVVEAVNVDGMRFFGEKTGDIALKNLPSNVVDKIQVTDYKSNLQKFTGEESDSGTKELNIKIKKGKNHAFFGDLRGGYSLDDKYLASANLFKLIDGKQIGLISGANNINMSRGFNSLPDTESSNGYIESNYIGTNYTKGKWNENRVNGNYRYSSQSREFDQKSRRENYLPNLNYITNSESSSINDSDSHRGGADLKFIIKPKSRNKVEISNEVDFSVSNNDSYSQSETQSTYDNGDLVSDYTSNNATSSSNYQINNKFRVTPVLGSSRDYFNMSLDTDFSKGMNDGQKYSENVLHNKNTTIVQDQLSDTDDVDTGISLNTVWSKQLSENFRLIPSYNVRINHSKNTKNVYDFNDTNALYDDFNEDISSNNTYITSTLTPSLRLRYELGNFRYEAEGAYTNTYRNYNDKLIEARNFKTDFKYLTYSGRIRYRDEKGYKNINLNYRQNVGLPSISQLQPVPDVSNQLNIRTGNPNLKPSLNHRIDFQYQNNIAFNNISINGGLGAQFMDDKIINSTITDEDLIKTTTYDNIDGDYSLNGNVNFAKSYYSNKNRINFNLSFNGNFDNDITIQNGLQFITQKTNLRPRVGFKYSFDDKIDFGTSYSYSLVKNAYDTDVYDDLDYFVQNVQFDSSIYFFKNIFFSNKVSYRYNSRVGDDFDGDVVFWNASLGAQLWNKKATITLVGYDMLGKNNGYRRTVAETYVEDAESRILEQYFMLTFDYKFGRFAGQNMKSGFNPERGGGNRSRRGR